MHVSALTISKKESQKVIVLNNPDLNIDQNNPDYDFCHNRAALVEYMNINSETTKSRVHIMYSS